LKRCPSPPSGQLFALLLLLAWIDGGGVKEMR
jgi:hypothetical protein